MGAAHSPGIAGSTRSSLIEGKLLPHQRQGLGFTPP